MSKKEQITLLAEQGLTMREIAGQVGVTRQYVSSCLCGTGLHDFIRLREEDCIYPNLRKWWNEHRMTLPRFFEAMGMRYHNNSINRLHIYMRGDGNPRKDFIDKLIAATGLPYETLFYREGD